MAFEGLSEKLQSALKKMTGRGKLSEQAVKEGMREVSPPSRPASRSSRSSTRK